MTNTTARSCVPSRSRSRTGRHLLAGVILATMAPACALDIDQNSNLADDIELGPDKSAATEAEEDRLEADAIAEAQARKDRYMATGAPPPVPPELSRDPNDPTFVFVGYAGEATSADVLDMEKRMDLEIGQPMSSAEQASLDEEFAQQPSLGLFVNTVGETWRWQPRDPLAFLPDPQSTEERPFNPSSFEEPEQGTASKILIIGDDNRTARSAVVGNDMSAYPWRTMGALNPNGQPSNSPAPTCTATKIGPRHLLTAGHCVWTGGAGGSMRSRDWWHGQDGLDQTLNGGDPSPNGYKNIFWYWIAPGWYDHGWSSQDYAVLMLFDNQNSVDIGSLGVKVDSTLAGTSAWNFGYPGSSYECAHSPRADKLCGKSMWGMSANITRTEIPYLFFKHDIQKGHSGSPLYQFEGSSRYVVGVVTTSYTNVENRGVKIRKKVMDNIKAQLNFWQSSFD